MGVRVTELVTPRKRREKLGEKRSAELNRKAREFKSTNGAVRSFAVSVGPRRGRRLREEPEDRVHWGANLIGPCPHAVMSPAV